MVSSAWIASSHNLIKNYLISVGLILYYPLKTLSSEAASEKLHVYFVLTAVLCVKTSLTGELE